jgi:release factor glutamine methyltransferase
MMRTEPRPATRAVDVGTFLARLGERLPGDWPELDAQLILAHVLGKERTWVLAHPEVALTRTQREAAESAAGRLKTGTPLPYILGHWEFFGHDFAVTPDVLIPRPETETLVEGAIAWLQGSAQRRTVADVGTGSGAIGVTLAMHVPDTYVLCTDLSLAALHVAQANARKFEVSGRMDFVACDLLPPHHGGLTTDLHFDLICANLPYIPSSKLASLPVYGREPTLALDGGVDGLSPIRRLLGMSREWLAPGGRILLEIEATLGMKAISMAYDLFSRAEIHLHQDLSGRDRLLEIQF